MPPDIPLKPWQKSKGAEYRVVEDTTAPDLTLDDRDINTSIPGWPSSLQPLKRNNLTFSIEVALLILPIAFIGLGATAWSFDQKPTSDGGRTLQRIMLLGPSLFPLAFAALGGRSLRNIALWKAERGSTVGELEKLNGSQSFVSAVWLAFSVRSFNFVSVVVLLFWCLSPLGGQSSLRLLWPANSTLIEQHPVFYSNRDASSWLILGYPMGAINRISAIVSTSLETADLLQNSSVDNWKHPRIPRLRDLERLDWENDISGNPWIDTDPSDDTPFTSLTGVSIFGLQPDSTANFSVPYEYMYLNCTVHMRADANETLAFIETLADLDISPGNWPYNSSKGGTYNRLFNQSFLGETFFESSFFAISTNSPSNYFSKTVYYGTKDSRNTISGSTISVYRCSLHSVMVEANMECVSENCRVNQIRRSPEARGEAGEFAGRPWDVVHTRNATRYFFESFQSIGGLQSAYTTHPIDNYIYGNSSEPSWVTSRQFHDWAQVSDAQVSQRLSQVFNTYWDASRWIYSTTRSDPYARSSTNKTSGEPYLWLRLSRTNATMTRHSPIYKASVPWILILIFCSGILLLLGIANIFVALHTSVPDILGYVSSLTRDNPYVEIPKGGSTLQGTERARLIRDLKVQLADVQDGKEVGYIAFKSLGTRTTGTVRLRTDRMFN